MKTFITAATILTVSVFSTTAFAQFDRFLKNAQRQVRNEVHRQVPKIGRQIVSDIRNGRPVHTSKPPVFTHPVQPPVRSNPVPPPVYTRPVQPPFSRPPCSGSIPAYGGLPGAGYPIQGPSQCTIRPANPPQPAPADLPQETPVEELPEVESGTPVTLDGDFGASIGAVAVKIDTLLLEAEVTNWQSGEVTATLPNLPMAAPTRATVVVLSAEGEIADAIEVALTPPTTESVAAQPEIDEEPELPVINSGQELTLEGDLGQEQGQVLVKVAAMSFAAKVKDWNASEMTIQMPIIPLLEETEAKLVILRSTGEEADSLDIMFSPESNEQLSQL